MPTASRKLLGQLMIWETKSFLDCLSSEIRTMNSVRLGSLKFQGSMRGFYPTRKL